MADLGEELSDDDVFFGKMTLKEVKRHIWINNEHNKTFNVTSRKPDRKSVKIIETHSQPNLRSPHKDGLLPPGPARENRNSDESFIQMESLISKLCLSPAKAAELDLNNTLEIVDYILNNGPKEISEEPDIRNVKIENDMQIDTEEREKIKNVCSENAMPEISLKKELLLTEISIPNTEISTPKTEILTSNTEISTIIREISTPKTEILTPNTEISNPKTEILTPNTEISTPKTEISTPKTEISTPNKEISTANTEISTQNTKIGMAGTSPKYYTPAKSPRKQCDVFQTPSPKYMQEAKTPIFKTPANPICLKKPSAASLKKLQGVDTPSKSVRYRHIKSPIATYIKGSIDVPMVTNVCPRKPLPGGSLIPKLVKNLPQNKQNKENINLPTSAYKSAKKIKVVHVPDKEKPKNQVAKKLLSTLPQPPVILKHETREYNSERKPLLCLEEDSIADLSCLQADLSVYTQVKPNN